jgi:hypothetical protein
VAPPGGSTATAIFAKSGWVVWRSWSISWKDHIAPGTSLDGPRSDDLEVLTRSHEQINRVIALEHGAYVGHEVRFAGNRALVWSIAASVGLAAHGATAPHRSMTPTNV